MSVTVPGDLLALPPEGRRERLRELLRQAGILHATPDEPIVGRDGTLAPWTLYTLNVSLTREGAWLAASCLLDELAGFDSTQLATYGLTGVPLVEACVALSDRRYTGICIRTEPKGHGPRRQIEGPADRGRGVVLVDDSISSGRSFRTAARVLEEAGFRVEGGVCLVRFPYRGGVEWATARGYRVETVFDVWADLELPRPEHVPGFRRALPSSWADTAVPDGLHPAVAARWVAAFHLETGSVPQPPPSLDGAYDGRGGVYVSFRHTGTDVRVARDGFWHFTPEDAEPCRDLVLATVKTLRTAAPSLTLAGLPALKVGVSFFGPLERISPRSLDFARFGLVVRSEAWPVKVGGALPNTQVFTSEAEQFHHAKVVNARVGPFEPYELYRHDIVKCVEPGAYWLPYGAEEPHAWAVDDGIGEKLVRRARRLLESVVEGDSSDGDGEPVSDDLVPARLHGVAVTLYHRGRVVGCSVSWRGSLDESIRGAVQGAAHDDRFPEGLQDAREAVSPSEVDLCLSILHDAEWLGEATVAKVGRKLRPGRDSFSVHKGPDQAAIFLDSVIPHYNWTEERAAQELLRKAKTSDPPFSWTTYQTATWLDGRRGRYPLEFGFPRRMSSPDDVLAARRREIEMLAGYIHRSLSADGLPAYRSLPLTGTCVRVGSAARLVDALSALAGAGALMANGEWEEAAMTGLRRCSSGVDDRAEGFLLRLGDHRSARLADVAFLAAASRYASRLGGDLPDRMAARLSELRWPDGRIAEPGSPPTAQEQDFLPGAALLAFAEHALRRPGEAAMLDWASHLRWYQRRFRLLHPWGLVGWHTQAWSAAARWADPEAPEFVFEMADWALDWQLDVNGAFVTDLCPNGPSFHTAFVLEGIADAWELALGRGDEDRARRYASSWERGTGFLSRLIVYPEDTFWMRRELAEVGGVRPTLASSEVRIDYVSHTLRALVKGVRLQSS